MGAGAGIASLFIAPVLVGEGVMVATSTGAGLVMGNALSAGAALAIGTGIAFGSGAIGGAASDMLTKWQIPEKYPIGIRLVSVLCNGD